MLRAISGRWRNFAIKHRNKYSFCNIRPSKEDEPADFYSELAHLPGFILDKPYFPPQELTMEMGKDQMKLLNSVDVNSEIIGIFPKKTEKDSFYFDSVSM